MINAAEIAWHQGIDLYSMHARRITAFMEFESFLRMDGPLPKAFDRIHPMGTAATFEMAYNHYHNRMGMDMPKTRILLEQGLRPSLAKKLIETPGWSYVSPGPGIRATQIVPAELAIAWETLTHAEIGGTRTPPENGK
jgi:hypothetical protein